ncbi:hypothetical protein OFH85_004524, partial [Escherichia coli]|nr:hypothetical protein [Escherichia coli]EJH4622869.1 hypothetical protein [Escherichia coli]EJZ2310775.1 hypothetical protein [Escherichia coli]
MLQTALALRLPIEADIRGMPAEQRLAERQRKTKPLLKSLESWLREKMKTLFFGS